MMVMMVVVKVEVKVEEERCWWIEQKKEKKSGDRGMCIDRDAQRQP